MPKLIFLPSNQSVEVAERSKILASAIRAKIKIRFGCAAARCGTCAVRIKQLRGELSAMKADEKALLERMNLSSNGELRLSCQARIISGEAAIDLDFQDEYCSETELD